MLRVVLPVAFAVSRHVLPVIAAVDIVVHVQVAIDINVHVTAAPIAISPCIAPRRPHRGAGHE